MTANDDLYKYVREHSVRGQCRCGRCIDGGEEQPKGHTVNLTFFEVAAINDPYPKEFLALVKKTQLGLCQGGEHSYMEIGGILGDQGFALQTMALGHLLGIWELRSPDTMLPFLPKEQKMDMAGSGYVTINWEA